jgi:5-methyltetrahydropteroyltriglutamate--homocysteine methyltransferase
MVAARYAGQPYDETALAERLRQAVAEGVQAQIDAGIDVVNDGELSKTSFSNYIRERIGGIETRPVRPDDPRPIGTIYGRDAKEFPDYFAGGPRFASGRALASAGNNAPSAGPVEGSFCIGPIAYVGSADLQVDIDNFKAALDGKEYTEAYLPAITPGTVEHWLRNTYYKSDEEFVYAIADALHEEYRQIVDAGLLLQLDDPDLADAWQMCDPMSVSEYHRFAEMRIDALNHALRDIPQDRVRFHMCWGSYHGPHKYDIPLSDIADLILKVNAACFSIEASNPVHEPDWRVWEDVRLPDETFLIPGVVGHYSDFIESPRLVADRLERYAKIVGRENVMAGTDCGIGSRVGHPSVCWAKFEAMAEGARIASKTLWP